MSATTKTVWVVAGCDGDSFTPGYVRITYVRVFSSQEAAQADSDRLYRQNLAYADVYEVEMDGEGFSS